MILFFALTIAGCTNIPPDFVKTKEVKIVEDIDTNIVFEMGTLTLGTHKELRLILQNTLQEPVIINRMNQFCGCTILQYSSAPILPESSTEVKITFLPDHPGTFNKAIRMYLSSQKKPIDIVFNGEIVEDS